MTQRLRIQLAFFLLCYLATMPWRMLKLRILQSQLKQQTIAIHGVLNHITTMMSRWGAGGAIIAEQLRDTNLNAHPLPESSTPSLYMNMLQVVLRFWVHPKRFISFKNTLGEYEKSSFKNSTSSCSHSAINFFCFKWRISMVVQWLLFCSSIAGTAGSIRGGGIKIPHGLQSVKKKKVWEDGGLWP